MGGLEGCLSLSLRSTEDNFSGSRCHLAAAQRGTAERLRKRWPWRKAAERNEPGMHVRSCRMS